MKLRKINPNSYFHLLIRKRNSNLTITIIIIYYTTDVQSTYRNWPQMFIMFNDPNNSSYKYMKPAQSLSIWKEKKTSYDFSLILCRIVLLYSCINIMVKSFDVITRQLGKWFVFNWHVTMCTWHMIHIL